MKNVVESADIHLGPQPAQKCFGMVSRKPRWGLSLRGWVLALVTMLVIGTLVCLNVHPFLAVTDRIAADTLVVEGWVHEYAIRQAVAEYSTGHYQHLFTTGGPVIGKGGYINDYNTSASVGAELLVKAGIPRDSVQMVPSRVSDRNRTYSSAVALREWFHENNVRAHGINLVTEDAHARRSRLLFEKALGPEVAVGVIAASSPDYDAKRWWRYSDGISEVFGQGTAYIYAKFFFRPE